MPSTRPHTARATITALILPVALSLGAALPQCAIAAQHTPHAQPAKAARPGAGCA